MTPRIPVAELAARMQRFRARMDATQPQWALAVFLGRVNQYYFTGTMQEGALVVPRDQDAVLWVRRSFERACDESLFPDLRPMRSFRDAAQGPGGAGSRQAIHLEVEVAPLGLVQRFRKYFPCAEVASLDAQIAWTRARKSPYELEILARAGAAHCRLMEELALGLLREGMNEAELAGELFSLMVRAGHDGMMRISRFGGELALGQLSFGENSLYPTNFDGPGGCRGLGAFAPSLGSRDRQLQRGDLVFFDAGFTVEGYSTDKTVIYAFGGPLPEAALTAHERCGELQREIAARLKPGAIPSAIYAEILGGLDPEFLENFMGFGKRRATFLGHGVGLHIDEPPVIAEGFDEPLAEGMVLAVEPKKGVPGVGMVGTENTYLVTPEGGKSLTGGPLGPIPVAW